MIRVSIEKIKDVKKIFFDIDPDEIFSFMKDHVEKNKGTIDQSEKALEGFNHPELTQELKLKALQELQLGPFLIHLMFLVLGEPNLCIVYNNKDFCSWFVMGSADQGINETSKEIILNLINESFVVVNLKKIVDRIFQKQSLKRNDAFIIDFLTPQERKIIEKIRSSNAKEITISFTDNIPVNIKVTRNQIQQEHLNKIARYLKKGKYENIQFKTRNGQLISYTETEIEKL